MNNKTNHKIIKIITKTIVTILKIFGKNRISSLFFNLSEELLPKLKIGGIIFYCPTRLALWRARTLFTKEPGTIKWIETFKDKEILWDIGANIGVYSLYAASRNVNVVAFEPDASNYYVLNKNIELNKFNNSLTAYCLAFSDGIELGFLEIDDNYVGSSSKFFRIQANSTLKQGCISLTIDGAIERFKILAPDHIKIDVDGLEPKIIKGGLMALRNVKSVLVELDRKKETGQQIIDIFNNIGFKLRSVESAAILNKMDEGLIYNAIFVNERKAGQQ